jgi:type I restriction enzyme S subunit
MKLFELANIERGISWSKGQETTENSVEVYPVLRIGNIKSKLQIDDLVFLKNIPRIIFNKYRIEMNDIIMVGSNGNHNRIGNACIINKRMNFLFASFLIGIKAKLNLVDPLYLFYFLTFRRTQQLITKSVTGSTGLANLSLKYLENIEIQHPSLSEQSAIAHILAIIDNSIEQTEKLIFKYQCIKTGLMQDLLTKGIDENGNIRSEKTHKFKDSPLGRIPDEWEAVHLGDLFPSFTTGSTPRRSNKSFWDNGKILWVTSGELKYNKIFDTFEKITEKGFNETNLKLHQPGTFFIAITGLEAEGTRGSCAIIGREATTNQSCMAFNSNAKIDVRYFFQYYLLHGKQISLSYAQGTKQQSLNGKIVKKIPIIIPKNLIEQIKIIELLGTYDNLNTKLSLSLKSLESIKTGLMHDLLTGKVRISGKLIEEINSSVINDT